MVLLGTLKFAVVVFITAFVLWQIITPLCQGRKPFSKKGKK